MKYWQTSRGFTLMELMVVIGIIGMLLAALAFPLAAAREKARDRSRLADLGQIEFALAAYVQTNDTNIDCADGLKIDGIAGSDVAPGDVETVPSGGNCIEGEAILKFMKNFLGSVPSDPKGPGDPDYYYYFDPEHNCSYANGVDNSDGYNSPAMVFALNLEQGDSNVGVADGVCPLKVGDVGGYAANDPYVMLIDFSESY